MIKEEKAERKETTKETVKEAIKHRRSVRTFDGRMLSLEHRQLLEEHIRNAENPFGLPVELFLLDAKEHHLSSPVIAGTDLYLAGKVKREGDFEIAFGYTFEELCLYAQTLGIGTVMLAASLNRASFEKAIQLADSERMPVASPLGYPAPRMSIREKLMRKGVKADQRQSFETLFFSWTFDRPLNRSDAGIFGEALEMVRLAPSAVNRQPWRAVVENQMVHFFECHTMARGKGDDIQKVDIGIALCHFDLTMREDNVEGRFVKREIGISADPKLEYIISYELNG